jgi:hypothetical protein
VGATVERILRTSKTFDDFKATFRDRIDALGRVQGLLFRMKGATASPSASIETELSAQSVLVGEGGAVTLDEVRLRSGTVQHVPFFVCLQWIVTGAC